MKGDLLFDIVFINKGHPFLRCSYCHKSSIIRHKWIMIKTEVTPMFCVGLRKIVRCMCNLNDTTAKHILDICHLLTEKGLLVQDFVCQLVWPSNQSTTGKKSWRFSQTCCFRSITPLQKSLFVMLLTADEILVESPRSWGKITNPSSNNSERKPRPRRGEWFRYVQDRYMGW